MHAKHLRAKHRKPVLWGSGGEIRNEIPRQEGTRQRSMLQPWHRNMGAVVTTVSALRDTQVASNKPATDAAL